MRLSAGFVPLLILAACASEPEERPRPNIVYIMTDDHASHMMSAYGSKLASTPNLDRIASEGAIFRNAFVNNALCAPSRATLLTGKYSHTNGHFSNADTFDGSQQTMPKLLRAAGYQTAVIGKWHLRSDPTGFDYWSILPGQGAYMDPMFIEMGVETKHQGYVTDLITDFAIDWIEKRDKQKPFLLLYHHKAPHSPWQPAERHAALREDEVLPHTETFDDRFAGRAEPVRRNISQLNPELVKRWSGWERFAKKPVPTGLSEAELNDWIYQSYVKDYLRVVAAVDENVGRFLDYLEQAGLAENTMVIYTSDNGKFLGDHFLFDKRLMYEEPIRVPLAIRYPAGVKAGTDVSAFAVNVDYAPTILDYAGLNVPADMQGRSLRPLLEGDTPADWRKSFYYHYWEWPNGHYVAPHYGVRTERFKLIHHYDERYGGRAAWELIDLQADPHELKNVIENPGYAEQVAELKAELERLRSELGAPAVGPEGLATQ